jgi:hypothetical protein
MFLPLEESFPEKTFENFFTWVAPLYCVVALNFLLGEVVLNDPHSSLLSLRHFLKTFTIVFCSGLINQLLVYDQAYAGLIIISIFSKSHAISNFFYL